MPFSHHSHSGQFCYHAKNTLEEMVQTAINKGMQTLVLTEHIPRDIGIDAYPEEIELGVTTEHLNDLFGQYYAEAKRLQGVYSASIQVLVGFECDWIRPAFKQIVEELLQRFRFETFVGSVHHIHGYPIDFNRTFYTKARTACGGTEEALFAEYFDAQLSMLKALKPPIVGHFDLIRRESDDPNADWRKYDQVWERILRNLRFVLEYGGVLEINTSALRLGMTEPYPRAEICQEYLKLNGRFVLSDDSHGIEQVGICYEQATNFLVNLGVERLVVLEAGTSTKDDRFPGVSTREVSVGVLSWYGLSTGIRQRSLLNSGP